MFWRFGGYANISTLDSILDKPDVTLEDLLDESDLIQELKQHNSKLIEYLRDEKILRRLLEYTTTPEAPKAEDDGEESDGEPTLREKSLSPFRRSKEQKERSRRKEERDEWDKADKARQRYAYVASEILASETWSIIESLMANQHLLKNFWQFLNREPPLEASAAGYFTKVNETLLEKKTEETLRFVKSQPDVIPAMLKHIDCPMVMDLLLKIISMEKSEGGIGIVDWLQSQDLIPLLLGYLSKDYPSATQTSTGDFIKAIITVSANASGDTASCIGPNNLTRQLVSDECIQSLIADMLRGGNPLTVGVGIIIEVIRKNNSDYDMDNGAPDAVPSSNDPIYLGSLLRNFAKHVPDFMDLILSPNHTVSDGDSSVIVKRKDLSVAFGSNIEPLGFDRFKTCELMAELLHCSNMGLLNERGSDSYVRERDKERDRLKAEGSLTHSRPPTSAIASAATGDSQLANGASTLAAGFGTPEEGRRLEVANNAEDDGFEDVGTSEELAEDIEEDLQEKVTFGLEPKPAQIQSLLKQVKPRLDLDEEFVDEPLTSPRLEAVDEKEGETIQSPKEPKEKTTSPTTGLTPEVSDLSLDQDAAAADEDMLDFPDFQKVDPDVPEPLAKHSDEAPPLPKRERPVDPTSPGTNNPLEIFSHPDDKPAPLFANRADHIIRDVASPEPPNEEAEGRTSQDTIDTTLGEEGDSARSILMDTNEQILTPQIENDENGEPLVGDLLKMMFVEHEVIPTILDFFFRFPWNNFLHNVVYDVVQQVFNGPMDKGFNRTLAIDLFETGRITERIVEGQQRSDDAQTKNNMRLGYMGHLTLIAEEVVKFSDRHPHELLSQPVLDKVRSKQWSDYVENKLSETRERDNAILGGIPPNISVGPRQAVLNAVNAAHGFSGGGLTGAGLNGTGGLDSMDLTANGSSTSSAFGLSTGSLLSGFGSSSDEEDEEMEEVEGDEAGISGSDQPYTTITSQPLTALSAFNTSNASPPSDPAPAPPPLNLPPSRARRQFAARLALHSQQAAQAQAEADAQREQQDQLTDGLTTQHHHSKDIPQIHIVPDHADLVPQMDGSSGDNRRGGGEVKARGRQATVGKGSGFETGAGDASSDEDAESEEMRFGGEGLEGFANSPADGDDGVELDEFVKGEAGHEEDIGRMRR